MLGLVRRGEPLACVLPDRLEHAVTDTILATRTVGHDQQRPIGEALQQIQHRERADGIGARDDLGRVEREATGEHRKTREQASLGIGQQLVAPVDRRAERLLARDSGARTTGEEPEAVIEAVEDLLRAQHASARGRELDRERDAVEPVADPRDRRGRRVVEVEVRPDLAGALDEELHRLVLLQGVETRFVRAGERQARHPPCGFAGHAELLSAGREHDDAGTCEQDPFRDLGGRVDEVLAVVEHHERGLRREMIDEHVERRAGPAARGRPTAAATALGTSVGVGDRCELDEPRPVGEAFERARRELEREPRLPAAAGTGEREHAGLAEELAQHRELGFAPDEAGELHRQVVGEVVDRSQRREVVAELGVHELVDVLGPAEVLQPVYAEVAQRRAVRQPVADELARRLRQHDLAAVPGVAQAGGAVQSRARRSCPRLGAGPRRCGCPCAAGAGSRASCRWISSAHATASDARANAATKLSPSPCSTGRTPWCQPSVASTTSPSASSAPVISWARSSHPRVEPSTSARSSVTVPLGRTSSPRSFTDVASQSSGPSSARARSTVSPIDVVTVRGSSAGRRGTSGRCPISVGQVS